MKLQILNFLLLFSTVFSVSIFSQTNSGYSLIDKKVALVPMNSYASIDSVANFIKTNFKTETDKIRAVFYWTASNISYDVANMFSKNENTSPKEKMLKTLKTKKGICGDYAAIFNEVALSVGIKSFVITGYTKQNGKIDILSHGWCAAKIDNKWCFFDPTWGSGAVLNGKFIHKINDKYFKVEPSKMIASHISFDYLWQFSNYPISNLDFYQGKIAVNIKNKYFDYENELERQASLSEIDQEFESAERIKSNGLRNELILDYYKYKNQHVSNLRNNDNVEKLNKIVNLMNESVRLLNDFIYYRNNKFKPALEDEEISAKIQNPIEKLLQCKNDLAKLGSVGSQNEANVLDLKRSIDVSLKTAKEHESFVKNYLSKSKLVRKTMFSKVSWFGLPLN